MDPMDSPDSCTLTESYYKWIDVPSLRSQMVNEENMSSNVTSRMTKCCVLFPRYIICQGKRSDSLPVQQYLFSLNNRMCHIWPGVSHSNIDIQEVVPYDVLQQDEPFCRYIYTSNVGYDV